jgi:hypothetical protein
MLDFKEITLADKEWMDSLLKMSNFNAEEYNFTFCYIWRNVFKYTAARMWDYLIIRSKRKNHPPSYHFPAGSGDLAPVIDALAEEAAREEAPLTFHIALTEQKTLLETTYPGQFVFLPLELYYDYVYDAQSLITLAGKKLHQKRTHINRFKENNPDWTYEPITPENLPEVLAMNEQWLIANSEYSDKSMEEESRSVGEAINDFFALKMDGGLIRAGGRVIAFSMGDRLNSDTYLVHIEKAFGDIQGAYAIINQEFAAHNCEGYLYIDREDDSGEEGLRKAKQSYRPVFQVEKFAAKKVL